MHFMTAPFTIPSVMAESITKWHQYYRGQPPDHGEACIATDHATVATGAQVELASPRDRLYARIIDSTIFILLYSTIIISTINSNSIDNINARSVKAIYLLLLATSMMLTVLYEVSLVAVYGQTLGKMWMKIRVVRADNGRQPGWGKAIRRWLMPVLLMFPFILGLLTILSYLTILGDHLHQGWHDKAAGTIVVKVRKIGEIRCNQSVATIEK